MTLIACDFVSMYPSHSQKGKNIYFTTGNMLSCLLPFTTNFLSGQDNLSSTFVRSISLLTVAMATEKSPIKVPCENESLMNLLRGVFPVKGEGGDCTHYLSF